MKHGLFARFRPWHSRLFLLAGIALWLGATAPDAHAQTQSWQWARNTGATQAGETAAMWTAAIPSGGSYVLGEFSGTVQFGATTLTSAGDADVFLARYDTAGTLLWARQIGGSATDEAHNLTTDVLGNVYVGVGFGSPAITLGTHTFTNQGGDSTFGDHFTDLLLARADANGQWVWAQHVGAPETEFLGSMLTDGMGGLYVAGSVMQPAMLGTTQVGTTGDTFIARLDAGLGQWRWAVQAGSMDPLFGGGATTLAWGPQGRLYVGGAFAVAANFGATQLFSAGGAGSFDYESYIAALDTASRQWQWAVQTGGTDFDYAAALAADPAGTIYVGGVFSSPELHFGPTITLQNQDQTGYSSNSYVAALNAGGQWQWATVAGSPYLNALTGLVAGNTGEVYVAGLATDTATFGTTTLSWPIVDNNGYLARLDGTTGTWQWAVKVNDTPGCGCGHLASEYMGLARDLNGRLLLAGRYTDSASFGTHQLVGPQMFSSGQGQGFLARFSDVLPLLLQLSPAAGTVGTSVTLTGQRLGAATQVLFNGVPASFTVVSPTQITVTVPPGASTGVVSVTTPAGTVNSPVVFRVGPTGLAEAGERAFSLWPNPAHASVRLTLLAGPARQARVLDALGRVVIAQPVADAQTEVTLSLAGLPAGLYTVRVGNAARKLVVE